MIITAKTTKEQLAQLSPPCRCKACEIGCFYGSGVLEDADLPKIANHLSITVEQLKKEYLEETEKFHTKKFRPKITKKEEKKEMPFGQCIFFDKGCSIHEVKPLECKVSSGCNGHGEEISQWMLAKHFVNGQDPQSIREWSAWLKHNKAIPGASLSEMIPDQKKLRKILNYEEM